MYLPHYPSGESSEHQEQQGFEILSEIKKRERATIKELMSNTFAHRRQDVVGLQLSKEKESRKSGLPYSMCHRWENQISLTQFNTNTPWAGRGWNSEIVLFKSKNPFLSFSFSFFFQVNAEFHRITTINPEAKSMFLLDHYTPKLLDIFQAKKGAAGERHRTEMKILHQVFQFAPLLRCFSPSPVLSPLFSLLSLIYFLSNWLFYTLAFNTRSYASFSLYSNTMFLNLLYLSVFYICNIHSTLLLLFPSAYHTVLFFIPFSSV